MDISLTLHAKREYNACKKNQRISSGHLKIANASGQRK